MDLTVNGDDPVATGKSYHTDVLTLVGKTGTAQYTLANGKYTSGTYNNIRSFSGVFPKDKPEYIIYLSVKDFMGTSADLGKATRSLVESIAKYKNIEQRKDDTDKTKIVQVKNYINVPKEQAITDLENKGLIPIVIGNGSVIIEQSIIKNTKVINGTKIFLMTNGEEYLMPNAIGWNSNEIINLANMLKIKYNINGFGKVQSLSMPPNTIIDINSVLEIVLDRSVVNEKEEKDQV